MLKAVDEVPHDLGVKIRSRFPLLVPPVRFLAPLRGPTREGDVVSTIVIQEVAP